MKFEGSIVEAFSIFGEGDVGGVAVEQLCSQGVLQGAYLLGESWLGDVQHRGGFAEIERFRDGNEAFDLPVVHSDPPCAPVSAEASLSQSVSILHRIGGEWCARQT